MPEDIKAKEWKRYVDDCFIVYEHSEEKFHRFLDRLNTLDPYIKFTYEFSKPGNECGLPSEVQEALPFLDLMVMRCMDSDLSTLSNKLCIYRKACHRGSYIHAFSAQPTSTKRAVIRNMFLRAYRYCDSSFLETEEHKIYEDFDKLGYSRNFVTKAKISARQGRDREIRIRAGLEAPNPTREKPHFYLGLPFNKATRGLKHQFGRRGIEVAYTSRDSIGNRITHKKHVPTKSGIYVLTCKKDSCDEVYIGQSHNIPKRLNDHRAAKHRYSMRHYTSIRHTTTNVQRGHELMPDNSLVPYKSNSLSLRLII